MQSDLLSTVLMPFMLAFIMFALGLGLRPADFRRIASQPHAFFLGILCHFVLLPLSCFVLLTAFPLPSGLAVGFMLISACPTGTTSNLLTYIARGDVALALSFTAAASLLTVFTLPLIVSLSMAHFLGSGGSVPLPLAALMMQIFLMLAVPVGCGMLIRRLWPRWAISRERLATRVATVCFALIVIGSLLKNWALFKQNFSTLAPLAIGLNLLMLAIGFGVGKLGRLERKQAITLAIETAMQNASLAIIIGATLLRQDDMTIPGAVYGVLMYAGGLVFAFTLRRGAPKVPQPQQLQ